MAEVFEKKLFFPEVFAQGLETENFSVLRQLVPTYKKVIRNLCEVRNAEDDLRTLLQVRKAFFAFSENNQKIVQSKALREKLPFLLESILILQKEIRQGACDLQKLYLEKEELLNQKKSGVISNEDFLRFLKNNIKKPEDDLKQKKSELLLLVNELNSIGDEDLNLVLFYDKIEQSLLNFESGLDKNECFKFIEQNDVFKKLLTVKSALVDQEQILQKFNTENPGKLDKEKKQEKKNLNGEVKKLMKEFNALLPYLTVSEDFFTQETKQLTQFINTKLENYQLGYKNSIELNKKIINDLTNIDVESGVDAVKSWLSERSEEADLITLKNVYKLISSKGFIKSLIPYESKIDNSIETSLFDRDFMWNFVLIYAEKCKSGNYDNVGSLVEEIQKELKKVVENSIFLMNDLKASFSEYAIGGFNIIGKEVEFLRHLILGQLLPNYKGRILIGFGGTERSPNGRYVSYILPGVLFLKQILDWKEKHDVHIPVPDLVYVDGSTASGMINGMNPDLVRKNSQSGQKITQAFIQEFFPELVDYFKIEEYEKKQSEELLNLCADYLKQEQKTRAEIRDLLDRATGRALSRGQDDTKIASNNALKYLSLHPFIFGDLEPVDSGKLNYNYTVKIGGPREGDFNKIQKIISDSGVHLGSSVGEKYGKTYCSTPLHIETKVGAVCPYYPLDQELSLGEMRQTSLEAILDKYQSEMLEHEHSSMKTDLALIRKFVPSWKQYLSFLKKFNKQ